jgi:hypothetical protein
MVVVATVHVAVPVAFVETVSGISLWLLRFAVKLVAGAVVSSLHAASAAMRAATTKRAEPLPGMTTLLELVVFEVSLAL